MRYQITKLTKGHSTKSERRFMELLKQLHIPFQTKVKIKGREIDFLVGKNAIEIDGHIQDVNKNKMLTQGGYNPIHLSSWAIPSEYLVDWLKKL